MNQYKFLTDKEMNYTRKVLDSGRLAATSQTVPLMLEMKDNTMGVVKVSYQNGWAQSLARINSKDGLVALLTPSTGWFPDGAHSGTWEGDLKDVDVKVRTLTTGGNLFWGDDMGNGWTKVYTYIWSGERLGENDTFEKKPQLIQKWTVVTRAGNTILLSKGVLAYNFLISKNGYLFIRSEKVALVPHTLQDEDLFLGLNI